jgi:hypothetical protein
MQSGRPSEVIRGHSRPSETIRRRATCLESLDGRLLGESTLGTE